MGCLTRGLTRGDGEYGDDVTDNLRTIHSLSRCSSLKQRLQYPTMLEVRGEVFLPKDCLNDINVQRETAGRTTFCKSSECCRWFPAPAWTASITASRPLDIFVYSLNHVEKIIKFCIADGSTTELITHWGLKCNPYTVCHKSIE